MKFSRVLAIFVTFLFLVPGCGSSSDAGFTGMDSVFPLYVLTSGTTMSGDLWVIDFDANSDEYRKTQLQSGIQNPSGMAVSPFDRIYISLSGQNADSKILISDLQGTNFQTIKKNLTNLTGLATNNQNRIMSVSESLITIMDSGGSALVEITSNVKIPRSTAFGFNSGYYLAQTNSLALFDRNGSPAQIEQAFTNLKEIKFNDTLGLIIPEGRSGLADGEIYALDESKNFGTLLTQVINPISADTESVTGALFYAEGEPVNRIVRFDPQTKQRRVIAEFEETPISLDFNKRLRQ